MYRHPTLQKLVLEFTDNFVDTYRRLARMQQMMTLVEHNTILEEIVWPACQQDESLVADEVGVAVMEVLESLSKN